MAETGSQLIFQLLLVSARIIASLMFLPGLSETYFPKHTKLATAIYSAIVLQSVLAKDLPQAPSSELETAFYLLNEIIIGIVIGFSGRLYFWALDILGNFLAMLSGLSAASFFDPMYKSQVSIFSTFLSSIGIMAIFASDVHHLFLYGIAQSYKTFKAGMWLEAADVMQLITALLSNSLVIAFQISAPFLIVNIALQLGSGLLSRLIPNIQIFFVFTPIQVLINLTILLITLNIIITKILSHYEQLSL